MELGIEGRVALVTGERRVSYGDLNRRADRMAAGLRAHGIGCWATMDAGPHVKVLCAPADAPAVTDAVSAVVGVRGVDVAAPGPAARVLS